MLSAVAPGRVTSPYTINDMADDAAGLLGELGVARAHIVGVSMGGMIAQAMAIRDAAKVASLTSIMSHPGDRKNGRVRPALLRQLPRFMARTPENAIDNGVSLFRLISGPHFDEAEARRSAEEAFRRSYCPDGSARQAIAVAASPDRTWDLRRVRVPALVIHGLLDPLVTPTGGIATARAIPGAKLVMYPDMGHDMPAPRSEEIIDEIVAVARRAGTGGTSVAPAMVR
jgi:pimeloyl-ACP methyl ester carboxylesterase